MMPKEHKRYAAPKQHHETRCRKGEREDEGSEDKYDIEAVADLELMVKEH
jgi:hypothetical protein